jgi:hypothetical protein
VVDVGRLPRTSSGKTDYAALISELGILSAEEDLGLRVAHRRDRLQLFRGGTGLEVLDDQRRRFTRKAIAARGCG